MKFSFHPSVRRPRDAFALVVTLLILSLLVIVSVSYLSSMLAERQTADAYDSKAVAEQAAQTGVDNATAMLAQSFRDFPDSATVWDTAQTLNTGSPYNASVIVGGNSNEGTSLYLRAVPSANDSSAYAVALPHGTLNAADGTPYPANDPAGNDPSNPACKTFVLPLISGVPNGQARLVSAGGANPPASAIFPGKMDLSVSDPTKQNWTDLNVRRFGKNAAYPNGDTQGIIGSPPTWTSTVGPKPARAYWVNLKGSNGLVTGRYAFWIDDESFRLNTSLASASGQPSGTTVWPTDSSGKFRALQPGDLAIAGTLTKAADGDPGGDAGTVVNTRAKFPGGFFPDPLAFAHGSLTTSAVDTLRYLTTNQSGALNLSRHGSQRLNLNTAIATTTDSTAIQKQVNQLVQTLEFHLPYFGERFYRTTPTALNDATQVPGSPYAGTYSSPTDSSHSQIYYYKIAANLRDYVDTDSQPTMIGTGGTVLSSPPAVNSLFSTSGSNQIWAQGKECTPYIQEVAVRYRPKVTFGTPNSHYTLYVDHYIEFWNMSDRDISGSQMNGPSIWVKDQQTWDTYYLGDTLGVDAVAPVGEALTNNQEPAPTQIDVSNVVFRAGTVTVVTTDPDYANYSYTERSATGIHGKTNNPAGPITSNIYLCPVISGSRLYSGSIIPKNAGQATARSTGLELGQPFESTSPYTGTEISLVNNLGILDLVRGAITKTGRTGYYINTTATDTDTSAGSYLDYSYGSSMMGNAADTSGGPSADAITTASVSQLGDPRTTNEQLTVNIAYTTADATRFMASRRTLGYPNYPALIPEGSTATPVANPWLDYYKFPGTATSPDYTTAPAVIAGTLAGDSALTSIGQLGDIFDPARVPNPAVLPATTSILYSHGGGRTFKIGQHDDLYSDDPQTNAYPSGVTGGATSDYVSASNGWASWRLTDIFDIADPIQLPGRININGIMRDNGAAFLSTLQGFGFQPKTTSGTSDANIHGDGASSLAGKSLDTNGATNGFSQIVALMKQRLDAVTVAKVRPFFERGELGELGYSTAYPANNNPLFGTNSTSTNTTLVTGVDMNKTTDHSREELVRRISQMICTKGNTFTVYAVGQSIIQTTANGPQKITGTQRMRVTFRLVPKSQDTTSGTFTDFHPAYIVNSSGTLTANTFDPANPNSRPALNQSGAIGVIPRFAKPDRYDVQILQVASY